MSADETIDTLAGEYVLGTLTDNESAEFERRMAIDPDALKAVAAWQARMRPLAEGDIEEVPPSAAVWKQIKTRIAASRVEPMSTIRADDGEWQELAPGVTKKMLHLDEATQMQSYLVRFEPGSRFASHDHPADEECMMIEGDVRFGDIMLRAGDYHLARKHNPHGDAYSENGALIFIRSAAA